jgi:methanogenic corrinoid protein MtbC1
MTGDEQLSPRITTNEFNSRITECTILQNEDLFARFGLSHHKVAEFISSHLTYIEFALELKEPGIFKDYWMWNRSILESRKVPMEPISGFLEMLFEQLYLELPDERSSLDEIREAAEEAMIAEYFPPVSFIEKDNIHQELANEFLKLLLKPDKRRASELILGEVEDGLNLIDLYLYVLQPVLREVGRLWQINTIGVAEEHHASAATQLIMSQLYPKIFSSRKNGKKVLAACIGEELHEVGLRMVADVFELSGWSSRYLGANTPALELSRAASKQKSDIIALSVYSLKLVRHSKGIIDSLKNNLGEDVKILVGGYAFNQIPKMWKWVGADGYATDAIGAVSSAVKLLDLA